jgi:hypothetical protein
MSLIALALVLGHVALFGVVHEADEGTAAHLWQLLMAVQVPIIAFFAIKYVPQKPKQALLVLALQLLLRLLPVPLFSSSNYSFTLMLAVSLVVSPLLSLLASLYNLPKLKIGS